MLLIISGTTSCSLVTGLLLMQRRAAISVQHQDLTCTAYYAYSTGLFVQMAKALGKEDVAAEYEELYHKIVKKFQETFFDAEGNMTAQTQTAHIVALYFQLSS